VSRLPGTADEIRARVPPVLDAWTFMRENVLRAGVVDTELKELCFRFLADDPEVTAEDPDAMNLSGFSEREQLALRWAQAIVWDSDLADDALWERLHRLFSEDELVELGCAIGFELGQQHWRRTLGLPPRDS